MLQFIFKKICTVIAEETNYFYLDRIDCVK